MYIKYELYKNPRRINTRRAEGISNAFKVRGEKEAKETMSEDAPDAWECRCDRKKMKKKKKKSFSAAHWKIIKSWNNKDVTQFLCVGQMASQLPCHQARWHQTESSAGCKPPAASWWLTKRRDNAAKNPFFKKVPCKKPQIFKVPCKNLTVLLYFFNYPQNTAIQRLARAEALRATYLGGTAGGCCRRGRRL